MESEYGKPSLRLRLTVLAAVLAVLIGAPLGALLWMTSVPGHSWSGPLPPLGRDESALATRLERHVRTIAAGPHNVAHPAALERAALYLEQELAGYGYAVHRLPYDAGGAIVRNIEVEI